jgi:hypothetical protein
MTDPARAPARCPKDLSGDHAASAAQATNAFDALEEAYRAAACVRCMPVHVVENVPDSQRYFMRSELKALHAVIGSEIERRLELARSVPSGADG